MNSIQLVREQQEQIVEYFKMTESLKVMQEEFDVFLDIICPSLQLKV